MKSCKTLFVFGMLSISVSLITTKNHSNPSTPQLGLRMLEINHREFLDPTPQHHQKPNAILLERDMRYNELLERPVSETEHDHPTNINLISRIFTCIANSLKWGPPGTNIGFFFLSLSSMKGLNNFNVPNRSWIRHNRFQIHCVFG